MADSLVPVALHGATLQAVLINGVPHVAIRSIVDALGLDWAAQWHRIQRHPVLREGVVVTTTPSAGGDQKAVCLPLNKLNGWLFGISAARVKPELRERLIAYQRECFDVLAAHFHGTEARKVPTVADDLKLQVMSRARVSEIEANASHRQREHAARAMHDVMACTSIIAKHMVDDYVSDGVSCMANDVVHKWYVCIDDNGYTVRRLNQDVVCVSKAELEAMLRRAES